MFLLRSAILRCRQFEWRTSKASYSLGVSTVCQIYWNTGTNSYFSFPAGSMNGERYVHVTVNLLVYCGEVHTSHFPSGSLNGEHKEHWCHETVPNHSQPVDDGDDSLLLASRSKQSLTSLKLVQGRFTPILIISR
jgi:hypothetical protein